MKTYDLMAAPLIFPGQKVVAIIRTDNRNTESISAKLQLKYCNSADTLATFDGPRTTLSPGRCEYLPIT